VATDHDGATQQLSLLLAQAGLLERHAPQGLEFQAIAGGGEHGHTVRVERGTLDRLSSSAARCATRVSVQ